MKLSLILAHPGPGSFNHSIAETARQTLLRRGEDRSLPRPLC